MSAEETERTLRDYFDALLSGGDFARYFAEDVVWMTMETGEEIRGRAAVADHIVMLHRKLFDARPELLNSAAWDGGALAEALFVGTHTGEFAGIAPTGTSVSVPYCVVYDIGGGAINALRAYFPVASLIKHLTDGLSASAQVTHS